MTKIFVFCALLLSICQEVQSQNRIIVNTDQKLISDFKDKLETTVDSATLVISLTKLMSNLSGRGYILASYELTSLDSLYQINIDPGNKFNWVALRAGNVPDILLSKVGFKQRFYLDKPFRQPELQTLFKKVIKESENNGFPFASIHVDSITIVDNTIYGVLNFNQGPKITFDNIQIVGVDNVKEAWLAAFLDMKNGDLFSQKSINNLPAKFDELPFIELAQPPEITFQNEQATVLLTLKNVSSNNIDGIIGFLPNDQEKGKLLITGQLYLGLNNLFSSGKELDVKWQSLKPRSQLLDIAYNHPNLFRSDIDVLGKFYLLKEDTIFIARETEIATVLRQPRNTWKLFFRAKNTSVLSDNLSRDDLADSKINYYGGSYSYQSFLTKNIKRRGLGFDVELAVGSKEIKNNSNLPESTYTDIDFNSIQYLINGSITNYITLSKYLVLYQRLKGGKIFNDFLFLNDLYRVGGLSTIRGFNENHFYASDYIFSNVELQLHFQLDSYLFLFYDQAYLYYDIEVYKFSDYPAGLGLGLTIKLPKGLLNLAYALGKSEDQNFDFKLSKVHFGYVARF